MPPKKTKSSKPKPPSAKVAIKPKSSKPKPPLAKVAIKPAPSRVVVIKPAPSRVVVIKPAPSRVQRGKKALLARKTVAKAKTSAPQKARRPLVQPVPDNLIDHLMKFMSVSEVAKLKKLNKRNKRVAQTHIAKRQGAAAQQAEKKREFEHARKLAIMKGRVKNLLAKIKDAIMTKDVDNTLVTQAYLSNLRNMLKTPWAAAVYTHEEQLSRTMNLADRYEKFYIAKVLYGIITDIDNAMNSQNYQQQQQQQQYTPFELNTDNQVQYDSDDDWYSDDQL